MQPSHWVRDSMKYGQRVGAEGLIKRHHKRRQLNKKKKKNIKNRRHQKLLIATLLVTEKQGGIWRGLSKGKRNTRAAVTQTITLQRCNNVIIYPT